MRLFAKAQIGQKRQFSQVSESRRSAALAKHKPIGRALQKRTLGRHFYQKLLVTFDGLENLLQLHGLLEMSIKPLAPRALAILFLRIAANGHQYCISHFRHRAQVLCGLVSVHPWQSQIEQYDMRRECLRRFDGGLAVVDNSDFMLLVFEQHSPAFREIHVVVHDQDAALDGPAF